jgi:hypothetical protein
MKIKKSTKHNRGMLLLVWLLGITAGMIIILGGVRYYVNSDGTLTPAPVNANNYLTNLPSYNPTNEYSAK